MQKQQKRRRTTGAKRVVWWELSTLADANFNPARLTERQQLAYMLKKSEIPQEEDNALASLSFSPFRLDRVKSEAALMQQHHSQSNKENQKETMPFPNSTTPHRLSKAAQESDRYYYHHLMDGERAKYGAWTLEEHALFMDMLRLHAPQRGEWGLFSKHVPGRNGLQCHHYYRTLLSHENNDIPEELRYLDVNDYKLEKNHQNHIQTPSTRKRMRSSLLQQEILYELPSSPQLNATWKVPSLSSELDCHRDLYKPKPESFVPVVQEMSNPFESESTVFHKSLSNLEMELDESFTELPDSLIDDSLRLPDSLPELPDSVPEQEFLFIENKAPKTVVTFPMMNAEQQEHFFEISTFALFQQSKLSFPLSIQTLKEQHQLQQLHLVLSLERQILRLIQEETIAPISNEQWEQVFNASSSVGALDAWYCRFKQCITSYRLSWLSLIQRQALEQELEPCHDLTRPSVLVMPSAAVKRFLNL